MIEFFQILPLPGLVSRVALSCCSWTRGLFMRERNLAMLSQVLWVWIEDFQRRLGKTGLWSWGWKVHSSRPEVERFCWACFSLEFRESYQSLFLSTTLNDKK